MRAAVTLHNPLITGKNLFHFLKESYYAFCIPMLLIYIYTFIKCATHNHRFQDSGEHVFVFWCWNAQVSVWLCFRKFSLCVIPSDVKRNWYYTHWVKQVHILTSRRIIGTFSAAIKLKWGLNTGNWAQFGCRNMSTAFDLRGWTPQWLLFFNPILPPLSLYIAESYSVAGSDGSITPSVGSVPHQASGSSSPCSHSSSGGSRHPVSALKKWLTNPVRKMSSDTRGGAGKLEKQTCRSDRRQPLSHVAQSADQPRSVESHDNDNPPSILPCENMVSTYFSVCFSSLFQVTFYLFLLAIYCFVYRRGKMMCGVQQLLLPHSHHVKASYLSSCRAKTNRLW